MEQEQVVVRKGRFGSMVTGIIFGTLVGGTVALLMAPQPGTQTRTMLAQRGGEIRDRTRGMVTDARNRVVEVAEDARGRVRRVVSTARGTPREQALEGEANQMERDINIMEADKDRNFDS